MSKKKYQLHIKLHTVTVGIKNPITRGYPFSPNRLNSMHWAVKAEWKKAWEEEVYYSWQEVKKNYESIAHALPFKKTNLEVYVFKATKMQDEDNFYASLKPIIDGLIKAGLIVDDSYNHLRTKIKYVPIAKKVGEHIELHLERAKR